MTATTRSPAIRSPAVRPRMPTWALALVVPLVAAVAAVITLNVASDAGAAKGSADITIENFTFSPTPFRVGVGAKVAIANDDGTAHTLTADDGAFDTGPIDGGAEKTITVRAPGRYVYHCQIHPSMTGVIEAR